MLFCLISLHYVNGINKVMMMMMSKLSKLGWRRDEAGRLFQISDDEASLIETLVLVALSWRVQFIGPHSCWTHLQTQLLGSVTVRIVTSKLKVRNKDEWLEDVTYPLQRLHSLSIVCSAETYETDRLPVVSIAAITTAKHVHFISRKLIVNATFVAMLPFSKELHLT